MASYQTAAVVLGSKNWGEADKMVTLFTYDRGLVEAAAFGCRRPRSPLAAGMQMFSSIEVQLSGLDDDVAGKDIVEYNVLDEVVPVILLIVILLDIGE